MAPGTPRARGPRRPSMRCDARDSIDCGRKQRVCVCVCVCRRRRRAAARVRRRRRAQWHGRAGRHGKGRCGREHCRRLSVSGRERLFPRRRPQSVRTRSWRSRAMPAGDCTRGGASSGYDPQLARVWWVRATSDRHCPDATAVWPARWGDTEGRRARRRNEGR